MMRVSRFDTPNVPNRWVLDYIELICTVCFRHTLL